MFVVRMTYFNNGSVESSYSRIFDNFFLARGYAFEKRLCLNSYWCVDICKIDLSRIECVG